MAAAAVQMRERRTGILTNAQRCEEALKITRCFARVVGRLRARWIREPGSATVCWWRQRPRLWNASPKSLSSFGTRKFVQCSNKCADTIDR
jgi:hypothetical protein